MSAAVTQAAQRVGRQASLDRYLPGDEPEHWTGKRKAQSIRAVTLNLRWPKDTRSRHDLFRAWHETAMQAVCSKGGQAIHVMAVIWRFWNVSNCTAWPTNQTLAEVSGKSVKTIVRGVNQLSNAGFFNCQQQHIKDANGNQRRRRTINFVIPETFEKEIFLTNLDDERMDNSGPCEIESHMDNSGPAYMDNSGPYTVEDTVEGRSAHAA